MLQNTSKIDCKYFCLFRLSWLLINSKWHFADCCCQLINLTVFTERMLKKRSYGNHYIPSLWKDFFLFTLHTLTASSGIQLFKRSPSLSWPGTSNSQTLSPPYYPKDVQRLSFRSLERCLFYWLTVTLRLLLQYWCSSPSVYHDSNISDMQIQIN